MNVSNNGPLHDLATLLSGLQEPAPSKAAAPNRSAAKPGPEDSVRISERAKEFQKLYQAVSQAPDIRSEKVARLQETITAGTYNVSGQKVADKIITQTILDAIL